MLHRSYWAFCWMMESCTIQTYRKTVNFIDFLVMQIQSIHFPQENGLVRSHVILSVLIIPC